MPKLGQHLFYTAPADSGIKPGPYPCVVTSADGRTITAFGAGKAAAFIADVPPELLSEDGNPYKAPAPAPLPGVTPALGVRRRKAAKKVK